jgi:hypothetical protein
VLGALEPMHALPPEDLVGRVYDDVPLRLHDVALRSLAAHLDKLAAEGRVRVVDGRYLLAQ